jgi:hypothetical protein
MRLDLAAVAAIGGLTLAGAANADTFSLGNTTHPELYQPGPPAVTPEQVDANGSASAVAGGYAITGPDLSGAVPVANTTSLTATALTPETLTFFWRYISFDSTSSALDPAGYLLNGVQTQLTTTMPSLTIVNGQLVRPTQSGSVTFTLNPGDTYGFYVGSTDSDEGPGVLRFSTLATAVPEPAGWISMIAGFGLVGAGLRYRRRIAGAAV